MSCSFFVKNVDILVVLRDDLSFALDDDLPKMFSIDCQRRRQLVVELIFFIQECVIFSISCLMLCFQRRCSATVHSLKATEHSSKRENRYNWATTC